MCQFKSAICLKDRVFMPDYDSHTDMLEELGIEDDFLGASKKFVRVELSPADGDVFSDPMGWKIRIDQDITPDWFDHRVDEQRIKEAITEWMTAHTFRDGEHEVRDGVWFATGSATVILPKNFQTSKNVTLEGEAICINHRDHTVTSKTKWTVRAVGKTIDGDV